MDSALLVDVFVALAGALCVLLLLYGAWLCLPAFRRTAPKESQDEKVSDAVLRSEQGGNRKLVG
jgi:hypothetical protein